MLPKMAITARPSLATKGIMCSVLKRSSSLGVSVNRPDDEEDVELLRHLTKTVGRNMRHAMPNTISKNLVLLIWKGLLLGAM